MTCFWCFRGLIERNITVKDFADFLFGEGGIRDLTANVDYAAADYLIGHGF